MNEQRWISTNSQYLFFLINFSAAHESDDLKTGAEHQSAPLWLPPPPSQIKSPPRKHMEVKRASPDDLRRRPPAGAPLFACGWSLAQSSALSDGITVS